MTWVEQRDQRSPNPEYKCGNCGGWTGCKASLDGGPSPAWRPHKDKLACSFCGETLYDHHAEQEGPHQGGTLADWWKRTLEKVIRNHAGGL